MSRSSENRIRRNSPEKFGREERQSGNTTALALGAARAMCGLWSQDQFVEV
jgi:hypothetical protein